MIKGEEHPGLRPLLRRALVGVKLQGAEPFVAKRYDGLSLEATRHPRNRNSQILHKTELNTRDDMIHRLALSTKSEENADGF